VAAAGIFNDAADGNAARAVNVDDVIDRIVEQHAHGLVAGALRVLNRKKLTAVIAENDMRDRVNGSAVQTKHAGGSGSGAAVANEERSGACNFNVAVREWNDQIIFLRKIIPGGADKSYGIQVARLAGLPKEILDRAKDILSHLENSSRATEEAKPRGKKSAKTMPDAQKPQLDLL